LFTTTKKCVDGRSVILAMGPSGIGKTRLIQTLPDLSKVLIINADNGLKTLESYKEEIPVYDLTKKPKRDSKKKIVKDSDGKDVLEAVPYEDRFPKLLNFLNTHANNPDIKDGFEWLVFDDITEILSMLYFYLSQLPDFKDDDSKTLKLFGLYDRTGTHLMKKIRDFVPYNILFLGLTCKVKDEDTGKIL